jgi:DNA polymerase-1
MSKDSKKLVLIDGNAIIHRAYHALPPLTTKNGELVNAVYGFSSVLLKVLNDLKPDYIAASFDLREKTFRHKEFKDYKATRVKAPDELYAQIDRVKEVVRAFNIPIYEIGGFEADDVIGTIVEQSEKNPSMGRIENIIVTGDLDTLQLISPKTKVYALRRGMSDTTIYDEKAVAERYGLKPEQMIDYKGLCGDQSDNIPGVKGIGEKTAADLIQKYHSLEGVYNSLGLIKGAVKEKLERDKMQAIMSKRLATIVRDVPLEFDFSKAQTQNFDRQKVVELFQELNFFSLIKRIPSVNKEGVHPVKFSQSETAKGGFNGVKDFKYEIIKKEDENKFIELLKNQKEIAISLDAWGEEILGLAFSYKTGRAGYAEFSQKFKEVLENNKIKKIGYDLKSDYKILLKAGIKLDLSQAFDIMLGSYVLNPGSKIELSTLVLRELGEEMVEEKSKGQLGLEIESPEKHAEKICVRADYIFKLKSIIEKQIEKISAEQKDHGTLQNIFQEMEMPLVEVLAEMEINGIKLNTIIFQGIAEKINKRIENLEKNIYKLSGQEFNINSPKQLQEVLFEKLKLPTGEIKKIKTGYSTSSDELAKLRKEHKIIEKIEEYREIFKLKTTYLDTLPNLVNGDSRIHTTFNQAVTATGRLSSSEPNLQNIPIKTDLGQMLRTAFEVEEGWKFVSADYSQIDLRVVAHVSGDKKMIETFMKGEDVHRKTAAEINKVPLSQVTEKMRSSAKALNFGVIYGMSVFGFSESAGIGREEAKKFINEYMEKFSGIAEYIRSTKEFAKKNLYVETELGRRRYIPEINSSNFQVQNAAERMAINMPIQGLSADIVKLAMLKVYEEFKDNLDVRMILQVHDEIILEVKDNPPAGGAEKVAQKVKEIMQSVYKLKVPLVADVKIGDNWGTI